MPAHSSISQSSPSEFKPPIVVVPADDKDLKFSIPPNKNFKAFYDDDADKLMRTKLMPIWNTTTIKFEFNGTGIAVAGLTRESFPLIPKNLL
ncbi:hypothetical protein AGABI2DRAFT_194989, partial [Agaricus bisporus var. bisporus H97]|uniref:hypothetical protein n=1 Tax=Agaricus bisporus var. bisporus (strain H97 / ATCC MYA-4626 / FGSC 10389) TaxID=936046 RepID=UPI00029F71BC